MSTAGKEDPTIFFKDRICRNDGKKMIRRRRKTTDIFLSTEKT